MLVFQPDTIMCPGATRRMEDFLQYDFLGPPGKVKAEEAGGLPGWFRIYGEAAQATNFGLLIVNFDHKYLKSRACRWEFGYIDLRKICVA